MLKGSSKKPRKKGEDEAQVAVRIMETVAAKSEESEIEVTDEMRAAAAAFGRIGGRIGGVRRAEKLTPRKRAEIAKKAAAARWRRR